jgi:RNA polymerase sigma factor (sigma-70 family)
VRIRCMGTCTPTFDPTALLPALHRYAWTLTRNAHESEDLVHDTLVRAYEARDTFRPGHELKPWLFSVLHNTFISTRRTRIAHDRRVDRAAEIAERFADPAQESSVRLTQVCDAFMSLPAEQREALHLVAIEGMSYQESAQALSIPVGTLMSRLGRARATLRQFETREPLADVVQLRDWRKS